MKIRILFAALLLLSASTLGAQAAAPTKSGAPTAETYDPKREETVRSLASELRCPVCQGLSVQDSPTELAQEMKGVIRRQLAEGKTPAEVRQYFVARYGEWILLEPKASGFNLVLYFLPLLGLAVGGVVIALTVRRLTARRGDAPPLVDEPDAYA